LQMASKNRPGQECKTPMPQACTILYDVPEACCSAGLEVPLNITKYCSTCQDSKNEFVVQDLQEFNCPGAQQQATVHAGINLMSKLRSRPAMLEFRQVLGKNGSSADVCTEECGDCVLTPAPLYKAIFKQVGQTTCCSSLNSVISSVEMPDSTAVFAFCSACKETQSHNDAVSSLFQTLCSVQYAG